jgi:hypothetical protein
MGVATFAIFTCCTHMQTSQPRIKHYWISCLQPLHHSVLSDPKEKLFKGSFSFQKKSLQGPNEASAVAFLTQEFVFLGVKHHVTESAGVRLWTVMLQHPPAQPKNWSPLINVQFELFQTTEVIIMLGWPF